MSATIHTLYYSIENLFNLASLQSLYLCKGLESKTGETMEDRFAITNDDRPIFDRFCRQTSKDVFKRLGFMAKGLDSIEETDELEVDYKGYEFGVDVTDIGENQLVYRFVEPEHWYSDMLPILQDKIEEALIAGVLKRWFYGIGMREIASQQSAHYDELISEARSQAMFRRKAPKKKYRGF